MQSTVESLVTTAPIPSLSSVTVPTQSAFVVVISHCCEFNPGKRNRVLLARLEAMPGHLTEEQLDAIRAANDFEPIAEARDSVPGVDNFVFSPLPEAFDHEMVAVFSSSTPFPMKHQDALLGVKRAELEHEVRLLFRKKLAWFVGGRDPNDIDESEKHDAPVPPAAS